MNASFSITPEIIQQYRVVVLQAYFSRLSFIQANRLNTPVNSDEDDSFTVRCEQCHECTLYGEGAPGFPHTCLSDQCISDQLNQLAPIYNAIASLLNEP